LGDATRLLSKSVNEKKSLSAGLFSPNHFCVFLCDTNFNLNHFFLERERERDRERERKRERDSERERERDSERERGKEMK
jgi:hypothetical protein